MSKKSETSTSIEKAPRLQKITSEQEITEYKLTSNDLRVLYVHRPGTGVVTSDIVYMVGSRDEARGETGIAHMLEHMLFKPTTFDIERGDDSAAMRFERETGINLNANTWKDRTSYYFSYPKEHFDRALRIEAERMRSVVLTDTEFKPEQANVLSEFDMYAGDEQFSLSVQMMASAFHSHPYGHETIGFREDIAAYTTDKLKAFYDTYYAPNNATLIIVGDVSEREMKETVCRHFATFERSDVEKRRTFITEPKQEGIRTARISRAATTNILGLGFKHESFPSIDWYKTMVAFDLLAGSSDSILHKALVDTGLAAHIDTSLEPTRERNLAIIFITLSKKAKHEVVQAKVGDLLRSLSVQTITPYLKKTLAKVLTQEAISRENSLSYTADLVEHASTGYWQSFFESEKILRSITPKMIHAHIAELIADENTTIGYFVGTK